MKSVKQIVQTAAVLSIGSAFGLESYIPTDGLVYHVDATLSDSMTKDTKYAGYENHVVEWRSDVGSVKLLSNAYDSPIYFADAFGTGKPGLRFGLFDDETSRPQSMYGNTATTNRTVVYVMKLITPVNCMELFGMQGKDYGFRMDANGSHYADSHNAGGVSWVNGYAWQPTSYPASGSSRTERSSPSVSAITTASAAERTARASTAATSARSSRTAASWRRASATTSSRN